MADIVKRDPWTDREVARSHTFTELERIGYERTCEECGRTDLLKESSGGHGWIHVLPRYVAPYGKGCYRGRFCADCWEMIS